MNYGLFIINESIMLCYDFADYLVSDINNGLLIVTSVLYKMLMMGKTGCGVKGNTLYDLLYFSVNQHTHEKCNWPHLTYWKFGFFCSHDSFM